MNLIQSSPGFLSQHYGQTKEVLVKQVNTSSFHRSFLAGTGVVLLNIAFVQVALKVCQIAYHLLINRLASGDGVSSVRSLTLSGLFSTTLITLNIVAAKELNIPLSSLTLTALSAATVFISLYVVYRNNRI